MPRAKAHAAAILREYHKAEAELIGKAVVLTDGKAGTVEDYIWTRRTVCVFPWLAIPANGPSRQSSWWRSDGPADAILWTPRHC
ncbi:hypothetical protein ACVWY3_000371 [Bradyrhizobium sp. USDA 4486]